MFLPPFVLHRPTSVSEATELLAAYGEDAAVYMGGTELLQLMKIGLAAPEHLIDCKTIAELRGLDWDGDRLIVGSAVTHRRIERDPIVTLNARYLSEMERTLANVRVRNAGTLCGNLCFAEPHSDPTVLLTALDASVELASEGGQRRVEKMSDFIRGPFDTALQAGELMVRVVIPAELGVRVAYRRIALHERPTASAAAVVTRNSVRIAVGSVGPKPIIAAEAGRLLEERGMAAAADAAESAAAASMATTDDEGGADYKQQLVRVLVRRAIQDVYGSARDPSDSQ